MSKYTVGPDIDLDEEVVLDRDGQRITEERAQQIADETLDEVRRGRPSLTAPGTHSPHVSFRVPEQLHRDAVAAAEARGTSVSALAREALEHYLTGER
jgi:predicted HicB family RNase H-like nuclease